MNLRALSSEGRPRPGTSWNRTVVRGGGAAFRGGCSLIVPHVWFKRPSDHSLFEVAI